MQELWKEILEAMLEADNTDIFFFVIALALYMVEAIGLYALAKRREIPYSWLAAVPGINGWILGSLADHYRLICGKRSKLGKMMLILVIVLVVLVVILCGCVYYLTEYVSEAFSYSPQSAEESFGIVLSLFAIGGFISAAALMMLSLAYAAVRYVCAYFVFASCDPQRKNIYLLACLVLPPLLPVALFLCRNKDLGMVHMNYTYQQIWDQ